MRTIRSETYYIYVGEDVFEEIQMFFRDPEVRDEMVIILVDENTRRYCLPVLRSKVPALAGARVIEVKSGEQNKTINTCIELWKHLLNVNAQRRSVIINLGGGVIMDMGGFVASTYKRGIRYVNIPTTLLAQVDAAVGGKVGVNLFDLKNQIGLFSQPQAVFIIPSLLATLDDNQKRSGFAEMIKHALITDQHYWEVLRSRPFTDILQWDDLILRSVEIKNSIVGNDPVEKSLRRRLNFGHTYGHAFETMSLMKKDNRLTHGHAVALGMICETYLSNKIRGLSGKAMDEIVNYILDNFKYYPLSAADQEALLEIMRYDKKNEHDRTNLTLLPSIGNAMIDQWCSDELITGGLTFYAGLHH
jgi:3-dehydroquinate synthase